MFVKVAVLLCFLINSIAAKILFGAGSSAYQIEGAWNEDGKGPNIWDTMLHNRNKSENGDIACDSYHKWREDVENVKKLGLDFYRFSISWSRILPNGTLNRINQKGVEYYLNLIKALKAEGIEPIVTLYHWDMPQHIQENGGFLNTQFVDYFEDYVRLCFQLYAPYVKYWLTINEPTLICNAGYGIGMAAPGLNLIGDGVYQCSYVLLKAHARAYRVYDTEFKAKHKGQVGIVLNTEWYEAVSNSTLDLEAQERGLQFSLGIYANPVFLGNWPKVVIDRIANRSKLEGLARSRLPAFTPEEIKYINGTHDFFALNTYGSMKVQYQQDAPITYPSNEFDVGINYSSKSYPDGKNMYKLLKFINDRYHPSGIIITENGYVTTHDSMNDIERITVIESFISNVVKARVEGNINIIAYSVWSLMDDFEWDTYGRQYGLIHVDFKSPNRTRTWKKSAEWYKQYIKNIPQMF